MKSYNLTITIIHNTMILRYINIKMKRSDNMKKLLLFLKCLADENRLLILKLLLNDRFCVCELEEILEKSQSSISQHLSYFKDIDLLIDEKISKRTYYSLNRKKYDKYLSDLLALGYDPIEELNIQKYSKRFEKPGFVITKDKHTNNSCKK